MISCKVKSRKRIKQKMKPTLYLYPLYAPSRSVQLTADVLDIEMDLKTISVLDGEQYSPDFLKINPHHTIPVYVDDQITITESRAIMMYLANKFAPNSSLYPSDPVKRARVDQALLWDAACLYPSTRAVNIPILYQNAKLNENAVHIVHENLKLLNEDLSRSRFIAGDTLTIADLSLLVTWTTIEASGFFGDTKKYPNIHTWFDCIKKTNQIKNWDELVVNSAKGCGELVRSKLNSNK